MNTCGTGHSREHGISFGPFFRHLYPDYCASDARLDDRENRSETDPPVKTLACQPAIGRKKSPKRAERIEFLEKRSLVGQLSSIVAHELNTPLAAIQNITYMLRKEDRFCT